MSDEHPEILTTKAKGGRHRPGRPHKVVSFTPAEAREKATRLLQSNYSPLRVLVVKLLRRFLVLTEDQLFTLCKLEMPNLSERPKSFWTTLGRYRDEGVVISLPGMADDLAGVGITARVPKRTLQAYMLGAVGTELADRLIESDGRPLMTDGGIRHRPHDLICNEAMIRMSRAAAAAGKVMEPRGAREVAVWDPLKNDGKGAFRLVPDGMLINTKEGKIFRAYLIEYHNEENLWPGRAEAKIKEYEAMGKESALLWKAAWGLDVMPVVLLIWRREAIRQDYQSVVDGLLKPVCSYAAISLGEALAGNLSGMKGLRTVKVAVATGSKPAEAKAAGPAASSPAG